MPLSGAMTTRHRPALTACAVALVAFWTIWATSATAQQRPRTDIWIFQYGGAELSDEHNQAFSAFLSMLHGRKLSLIGELTELDSRLAYLEELSHLAVKDLAGKPVEFRGSRSDLKRRWRDDGTLTLLYGLIRKPSAEFKVRSQFYYGDLHGELATTDVGVEADFKIEDFALASESHTAATIYAIAMEAAARGLPNQTVVALLNKAESYAKGVTRAEGIAPLRLAIEKSLARLAGGR